MMIHAVKLYTFDAAHVLPLAQLDLVSDESVNPFQWNKGEWDSQVQDDAPNFYWMDEDTQSKMESSWHEPFTRHLIHIRYQ